MIATSHNVYCRTEDSELRCRRYPRLSVLCTCSRVERATAHTSIRVALARSEGRTFLMEYIASVLGLAVRLGCCMPICNHRLGSCC